MATPTKDLDSWKNKSFGEKWAIVAILGFLVAHAGAVVAAVDVEGPGDSGGQ